jgi:hypothetical protein
MKWRRGAHGYAAVLMALYSADATTSQLQRAVGTQNSTMTLCVRGLYRHGLICVGGYRQAGKGCPAVVWRFGPGPDAPAPRTARAPTKPAATGVEMVAFAAFVRCLMEHPSTLRDLREASGFGQQTTGRLVRFMRGALHIKRWDRLAHIPQPAYVWGRGPDAVRPRPQPVAVVTKRYDDKRRALARQVRILDALRAPMLEAA